MQKVFVSYRHESGAHQHRVRELATWLREAGLDIELDLFADEEQFHRGGPPEGWPAWSINRSAEAARVIVVASRGWFECFRDRVRTDGGRGAAAEARVICQRLYEARGDNAFVRVAYFDENDLFGIHPYLKGYTTFFVPSELSALVTWLRSSSVVLSVPSTRPRGITSPAWPVRLAGYVAPLADRRSQMDFVGRMLAGETHERILLLDGPSNCGKSALLRECVSYGTLAIGAQSCVLLELRGCTNVSDLLRQAVLRLGADVVPRSHRAAGADAYAWLEDLVVLPRPLFLLLDTWEHAGQLLREWIETALLGIVERAAALCVVVAGQEVPDHSKAVWQPQARRFTLGNIPSRDDWEDLRRRSYPHVDRRHLEGIVLACRGNPGPIANMLATLADMTPEPTQ